MIFLFFRSFIMLFPLLLFLPLANMLLWPIARRRAYLQKNSLTWANEAAIMRLTRPQSSPPLRHDPTCRNKPLALLLYPNRPHRLCRAAASPALGFASLTPSRTADTQTTVRLNV